ncbi:MAG: twin-arginine translocase TatA/TatE family subunit [Pseudomonadota bacterium]
MFGLSFWEIAVIAAVALLALGPKRIPNLAHAIGRGLRELRRATASINSAVQEPLEEIRRPLQDIRNDLMDAVYNVEREIEKEAEQQDPHNQSPAENSAKENK